MQSEPIVVPQDNNQEIKHPIPSSLIQHGSDYDHEDPVRGFLHHGDPRTSADRVDTRGDFDPSTALQNSKTDVHIPLTSPTRFADSSPLASSLDGSFSDELVSSLSERRSQHGVWSSKSKPQCPFQDLPNGMHTSEQR